MEQTQTVETSPPLQPEAGFFGWVRSLGIVRTDGWVGGVCAAIAGRTGADPIIIRGMFVVAAVLGFPAIWLYAIGWALLPDEDGRIIARLRQGSAPGALGVVITVGFAVIAGWTGASVVGAILTAVRPETIGWNPVGLVLWAAAIAAVAVAVIWLVRRPRRAANDIAGSRSGRMSATGAVWTTLTAIVLGIALIAAFAVTLPLIFGTYYGTGVGPVLAFLALSAAILGAVWLMRTVVRNNRRSEFDVSGAAFADTTRGAQGTRAMRGSDAALPDGAHEEAVAIGVQAAKGVHGAEADAAYDQWRQQQEGWRADHEDWRVQQKDAERAARDEMRDRRREEVRAFAEEVSRRRAVRRATRPRTSFAFVASVVGLAIIAGALTALVTRAGDGWASEIQRGTATVGGALFAVAAVCAIGMVVAGFIRRRSGFLSAVTIIALLLGAGTTLVVSEMLMVNGYRSESVGAGTTDVTQAYGWLELELQASGAGDGIADVERRGGTTQVNVPPDVNAELHFTVPDGMTVAVVGLDDEGYYKEYEVLSPVNGVVEWSSAALVEDAPTRTVELTQLGGGEITIWVDVPVDQPSEDASATDEEDAA